MKVDFNKEEVEQLKDLVRSHVIVLNDFVRKEDDETSLKTFRKAVQIGHNIYAKLTDTKKAGGKVIAI